MRSLRQVAPRLRSRGFSLIELMVAAAIGMIVALALTGAVVATGRQYSMLSATIAAQNGAQIALSQIDLAARGAGSGFYANGQPICPTWNAYNPASGAGATLIPARTINGAVFMPVKITDGGDAQTSDSIVFTGGTGAGALVAAPVLAAVSGNDILVPDAGFADGDIAVIGAPGASPAQPCTLFIVNGNPGNDSTCGGVAGSCKKLKRSGNASTMNGGTFTTDPVYAFTGAVGQSVVSRVATSATGFRQEAFRIECNSLVRYNAFPSTPGGCTANPLAFATVNPVDAIASDIVLMHAQYGITASAASDIVTNWVDASGGTWANPTAANVARIKAIRVVLVARSKEPDGSPVTPASCDNAAGISNTGPCSFQDAEAPVIDLSALAVPAGKTWRHYRYRVHLAIMPLRAVLWSD